MFDRVVKSPDTGCWNWQGAKRADGYGMLRVDGLALRAHRFVYEQFVAFVPDHLDVDHMCGNPGCVNPEHLEAVTHKVNIQRGYDRKRLQRPRTHCRNGHALDNNTRVVARPKRSNPEIVCLTCAKTRNQKYESKKALET